MMLHIESIVK